ncbi:MAG: hypothetical protein LBL81_02140, partial [Tannerella sp.]|nr:hypothetical protein [Tannerella sp.]
LALCQPLSILQWQCTSDYSLLWGDGIYASDGPLRPTQRFWNLKQLASTAANSFVLPVRCNQEMLRCAAFGKASTGNYAVHIINDGAARKASVKGLPKGLAHLKAYATTFQMRMQEIPVKAAADGSLSLTLPATAFVSIFVDK